MALKKYFLFSRVALTGWASQYSDGRASQYSDGRASPYRTGGPTRRPTKVKMKESSQLRLDRTASQATRLRFNHHLYHGGRLARDGLQPTVSESLAGCVAGKLSRVLAYKRINWKVITVAGNIEAEPVFRIRQAKDFRRAPPTSWSVASRKVPSPRPRYSRSSTI